MQVSQPNLSGSKLWIKKQGELGVIYMENGISVPILGFDDEPAGAFAYAANFQLLLAQYGAGKEVIVIQDPRQAPVSVAEISDLQIQAAAPNFNELFGNEPKRFATPLQTTNTIPQELKMVPSLAPNIVTTALEVFRDMLTRHSYAVGKDKKELGRDIEAVASFLIEVEPSIEPELVKLKESIGKERKRFSL